jgi:hypothetical protein
MPFTTEETGLSSSIVRNLNEEVKKSKLDRVVDFCLKQKSFEKLCKVL